MLPGAVAVVNHGDTGHIRDVKSRDSLPCGRGRMPRAGASACGHSAPATRDAFEPE